MFDFTQAFADMRQKLEAQQKRVEKSTKRSTITMQRKRKQDKRMIAVLDMETDNFDNQSNIDIKPFVACIYAPELGHLIIWNEDLERFIAQLIKQIEDLPNKYIIYAHNGGKFDYMFLINKLRGKVSFKGRAIMCASIGNHEIRDSLHLIPEGLKSYNKQAFDYNKLTRVNRHKHKQDIIKYLESDCTYLYEIVKAFTDSYGIKLSIGQASMAQLKLSYPQCANIDEVKDAFLRQFFFGGRVQCFKGKIDKTASFTYYDVNSMYPYVMASYKHPIGNVYTKRNGIPSDYTCFVCISCFSNGAFPVKVKNKGTMFPKEYGTYYVSIHEYHAALDLGLINKCRIKFVVDCNIVTTFDKFVLPLYEQRQTAKQKLRNLKAQGDTSSQLYFDTKKDDMFYKYLLNNGYGKFCQNPRNFQEYYLTDPCQVPDLEPETWGDSPSDQFYDYWIWSRPIKDLRFYNVGTGASVTGAARAVLLRAIHSAKGLVYCDTDSLICRSLDNVTIDETKLGAWKVEAQIARVIVAGKKLYAYETIDGKRVVRAKGASQLAFDDLEAMVRGKIINNRAFGATIGRDGSSHYMERRISATA